MESTILKNTSRGRTSGKLKGPITMEYAVGGIAIIINILFGIDMWNYKSKKYHIGKYTCLEYIPIWGLIAIIITNILKPYINKIIKIIPREFTYFISFIFALDFLITILTK